MVEKLAMYTTQEKMQTGVPSWKPGQPGIEGEATAATRDGQAASEGKRLRSSSNVHLPADRQGLPGMLDVGYKRLKLDVEGKVPLTKPAGAPASLEDKLDNGWKCELYSEVVSIFTTDKESANLYGKPGIVSPNSSNEDTIMTEPEGHPKSLRHRLPEELIIKILGYALTMLSNRPVEKDLVDNLLTRRHGRLLRLLGISRSLRPALQGLFYQHNTISLANVAEPLPGGPPSQHLFLPPPQVGPHLRSLHLTCLIAPRLDRDDDIHLNLYQDYMVLRRLGEMFPQLARLHVQFRLAVDRCRWRGVLAGMRSDGIVLRAGKVEIEVKKPEGDYWQWAHFCWSADEWKGFRKQLMGVIEIVETGAQAVEEQAVEEKPKA